MEPRSRIVGSTADDPRKCNEMAEISLSLTFTSAKGSEFAALELVAMCMLNFVIKGVSTSNEYQDAAEFRRLGQHGYYDIALFEAQVRSRSKCGAFCLKTPNCVAFSVSSSRPKWNGSTPCRLSEGNSEWVGTNEWISYAIPGSGESPQNSETTSTSLPETTTKRTCPEDFEEILGKCFKYHADTRTWGQAKTMCESETGHLVTVTSPDEQYSMWYTAKRQHGSSIEYYAGASYNDVTAKWEWVNGEPFDFTNWVDESSRDSPNTCLLATGPQGTWTDASCGVAHHYMCEIDI